MSSNFYTYLQNQPNPSHVDFWPAPYPFHPIENYLLLSNNTTDVIKCVELKKNDIFNYTYEKLVPELKEQRNMLK